MSQTDLGFHFSVPRIPIGEAVTFAEMEARCLKQLKESDGTCVQSLTNLVTLYSDPRHHDKARRCLERLIELSDGPEMHATYYLALGANMEKIRDYAGAAGFYRRALATETSRDETCYFIHNNLGYSLNELRDYEGAIPHLRRAIEINPGRPNAYKNLGLAFEAQGNFSEAAALFVKATQADAADPRSLAHLENLTDAHPELTVEMPELPGLMSACRKVVNVAKSLRPDRRSAWNRDRARQRRDQRGQLKGGGKS